MLPRLSVASAVFDVGEIASHSEGSEHREDTDDRDDAHELDERETVRSSSFDHARNTVATVPRKRSRRELSQS